ncbi:MAG: 5'-nucleotidase C-terminal domain-containing protein [Pseudomonadota bacterium]
MFEMLVRTSVIGLAGLAFLSTPALAEYRLTILHVNDTHARFEPINKYNSSCSDEDNAAGECFGGLARLETAIEQRRDALTADGRNVLTLHAGDQFQGSLFYTTYKGELSAELMDAFGFDAMVVGNHEFDDGPEALAAFVDAVDFPVLFANTDLQNEPLLAGKVPPFVTKDVGGETIGIIGVLAEDTDETSSPGPNVPFIQAEEVLPGIIETLSADGVDKIILLSHAGLSRDMEIAAAVDGIDAVVGGHSHTLLSNAIDDAAGPYPTMVTSPDGTAVPIVQAFAYTKYLGELELVFDDAGKVTAATGDLMTLDASVEEDEAIVARIDEAGAPLEEIKKEVVGEASAAIDGERDNCRAKECAMGVLVTDAMLERVADQGVTIAIQNGGGLRASIDAGPITMGEVLTVLPFQNTLATFGLTGAGIVAALENGVGQIEEGAGRFPQVAGLRYSFDPKAEAGKRITKVQVMADDGSFTLIDEAATYLVVSNDYMRGGGDGYAIFSDEATDAYDFGPSLEEVVADYLRANQPYEPRLDDRITIVE